MQVTFSTSTSMNVNNYHSKPQETSEVKFKILDRISFSGRETKLTLCFPKEPLDSLAAILGHACERIHIHSSVKCLSKRHAVDLI